MSKTGRAIPKISTELTEATEGGGTDAQNADPLEGYWNWLKTKVTIKEGKVVVDKR